MPIFTRWQISLANCSGVLSVKVRIFFSLGYWTFWLQLINWCFARLFIHMSHHTLPSIYLWLQLPSKCIISLCFSLTFSIKTKWYNLIRKTVAWQVAEIVYFCSNKEDNHCNHLLLSSQSDKCMHLFHNGKLFLNQIIPVTCNLLNLKHSVQGQSHLI